MRQTILTASGAVLAIQGIELAKINEGFSLLSTLVVTIVALVKLFKKNKTTQNQNSKSWENTPLYPKDENNNPEIM